MKPTLALIAAALIILIATPTAQAQAPPQVDWLTDLDRASAVAVESGRPLLVVFR